MFPSVKHVAKHAFRRLITEPRRKREWPARTEPFVFRGAKGIEFELDPTKFIDRFIFIEGVYERRFLELLEAMLVRRGVALDIGANIGNHSLYLSTLFGNVHAFEPNPAALVSLNRNVRLNPSARIAIHPVGLGETDRVLPFWSDRGSNLGASRFLEHPEPGCVFLRIANGDNYLEQLGICNVDFVKVDVEGHELSVLRGLARTIARDKPIVAFEHHGQHCAPEEFEEIRSILQGYRFAEPRYAAHDDHLIKRVMFNLRGAGLPELVSLGTPESRTYETIIAYPSD
jgi:FkbM family methyltransferase